VQTSFAVVSIKPNKSLDSSMGNRFDPELFSWTNVTVRVLIQQTYGLRDYQILSAPEWVNADRWDITAKSDGPTTLPQKYEMAKTMLRGKFQMEFHREARDLPIYLLTAVKDGPRFEKPADAGLRPGLRIRTGLISANNWDVSGFAAILAGQINTPVIDKVGLTGKFDFTLRWTPAPNEGNFASAGASDVSPADPAGPSLFSAIQDQLGLKLESSKGPIDVLVIDKIEKPSQN
jgi:uncharacterized protein (TIGR03435 family)